jgi:hypothetical protein
MADGSFLVRSSKSKSGEYVLILCHGSAPHHYHIITACLFGTDSDCVTPQQRASRDQRSGSSLDFSLDGSVFYPTLSKLVRFYASSLITLLNRQLN